MSDKAIAVSLLEMGLEHIKKGWTQGELARSEHGEGKSPYSKYAVCWCALGSLRSDVGLLDNGVDHAAVEKALEKTMALEGAFGEELSDNGDGYSDDELVRRHIANVNDSPVMTQARMIELFEKTIERVKSEGS